MKHHHKLPSNIHQCHPLVLGQGSSIRLWYFLSQIPETVQSGDQHISTCFHWCQFFHFRTVVLQMKPWCLGAAVAAICIWEKSLKTCVMLPKTDKTVRPSHLTQRNVNGKRKAFIGAGTLFFHSEGNEQLPKKAFDRLWLCPRITKFSRMLNITEAKNMIFILT